MNKYLFFLSIFLFLPHVVIAQSKDINHVTADRIFDRIDQNVSTLFSPLPNWVEPVRHIPRFDQKKHHYEQQYLLIDKQLNLIEPEPVMYNRYASKVVSIKGLEFASQISIDFDPSYQRVSVHRLDILRDGLTLDRRNSAKISQFKHEVDLNSLLYNGDETLHIVLDDVKVGDIIDFSYTLKGFNPVFGKHREWYIKTGWITNIALVNIRILTPKNSPFSVTNLDYKGHGKLLQSTQSDITTFTYQEQNGLYDFDESEQPSWFNPYPYLHISSYQTWADVVAWAIPLYAAAPNDNDIQALVADIHASYPSDKEKQIIAAIHFVQNSIRYLGEENGMGSHKPRPPAQVMAQGYGDCKDKTLLLVSMLQALDINAYPALTNTYSRKQLLQQPTAPFSFNHVIVQIDFGDQPLWIDATRTHQGNRLSTLAQSRLGYALVLKPETNALTQINAPSLPVMQDIEQKYVINHADENSYLTVKTTYRGIEAEHWRRYLESKPLSELGEEYANYYAAFFNALDLLHPVSFNDNPDRNELTVNESYVINGVWSKDENSYSFIISGDIVDDYLVKPDLIRRKTPFRYGTEGGIRQKIQLSLPEAWSVTPSKHTINNPYFEFTSSLKAVSVPGSRLLNKTYVEANYYYRAKARHVNADELRQYMRHVDDAWQNVDYEFTYSPINTKQEPRT